MPTGKVALDTTQYVRINAGLNPMLMTAFRDSVRIAYSNIKPVKGNTAFHMLSGEDNPLYIPHIDVNVWALATSENSSLSVTEYTSASPVSTDNALSAFGELLVVEPTPVIQAAAQYGLGSKTRVLAAGTGAEAGADSLSRFFCTSGTDATGFASVFSRVSAAYKAGEGLVGEFTAMFDVPREDNTQRAGLISATDALTFGYEGLDFGIIVSSHGQQEIQELQVTAAAIGAGTEIATVTIDGVGYDVILTQGLTVQDNAREIAESLDQEPGLALWEFLAIDDTVSVRSIIAEVFTGAFTFSSSTATATWLQLAAGVEPTRIFIPQSSWNGADVTKWFDLDSNAIPFNPALGNVYRVATQYLGFGNIVFQMENPRTSRFETVHTIQYANLSTTPSVSNPSFRIGWSAVNDGNTTSLTVRGASYAIFIEGKRIITGRSHSNFSAKAGLGATVSTNLLSIGNREVFGNKVNLASIVPDTVTVETDSNKGAVVCIDINPDILGVRDWQYHNKEESIALYDKEDSTVVADTGENVACFVLGPLGGKDIDMTRYNLELLPGEVMCISIIKLGGGTHDSSCSAVWEEDT